MSVSLRPARLAQQASHKYIVKETTQATEKAMASLMPSVGRSMGMYDKSFAALLVEGTQHLSDLHSAVVSLITSTQAPSLSPSEGQGPQRPSPAATKTVTLRKETDEGPKSLVFLLRLLEDARKVEQHSTAHAPPSLRCSIQHPPSLPGLHTPD